MNQSLKQKTLSPFHSGTDLIDAAGGGYIGEIKRLLKQKDRNVNQRDVEGWTALMIGELNRFNIILVL